MQANGRSFLQKISRNAGGQPVISELPLNEPNRRYSCLGMSIEDLYLYALDFNTKELLRIDASGNVAGLGVPENLDPELEYWAGDVSPEGRRLVVVGRDKTTGIDIRVYSINLTIPSHYAGSVGVISDVPTALTDLATDPIRGITYGFDRINRKIITLNINQINHYAFPSIEPVMESLFFDRNGNLFGYGSADGQQSESLLYGIDKIKGAVAPAGSGRAGVFGDGCSCPYTLSFFREVQPETLIPCSEFTIEYTLINQAGIGKTGVYFEDILPEVFTITDVVEHTFTLAEIGSGPGGHTLTINDLDILIGNNTIRIKGYLDNTQESAFETQAVLEGLPLGLGSILFSDDPKTPERRDPNRNAVIQNSNFELEDYIRYNCARDSATLSLPFEMETYGWNDGSVAPELTITQPGIYWIKAGNDCITLEDTIQVEPFPEPLSVTLREMGTIREGELFRLSYQTNAAGLTGLQWTSTGPFDLNCTDCPSPSGTGHRDNTYILQLTDQNGCIASDSVRVKVMPFRYLYAPNAFSPDQDGINDVFYLQGTGEIAEVSRFLVFDRWGNLVFEKSGAPVNHSGGGWDGRYEGRPAAEGIYIWIVDLTFPDGEKTQLSGDVMVMRHRLPGSQD